MSVWPSVLLCNLVFFGTSLAGALLQAAGVFQPNSGHSIAMLGASSVFAGHMFLKKHERPPTRGETWAFTSGAFFLSVCVSIGFFAAGTALAGEGWTYVQLLVDQIGYPLLASIALVLAVIYMALLYLGFGTFTRWAHLRSKYPSGRI